jgi:hypothetical protein
MHFLVLTSLGENILKTAVREPARPIRDSSPVTSAALHRRSFCELAHLVRSNVALG